MFPRTVCIAGLVLIVDEAVKTAARVHLAPCSGVAVADCDRVALFGPLWLLRTANAGSPLGLRQGWWIWIALAACGVLLAGAYARLLTGSGWKAALGVGLQMGGAIANLFDRLAFGGASDVLYIGAQVTWNLADAALVGGTLLATWALADRAARAGCGARELHAGFGGPK
jgi:lipoprotein signal peptidase